MNYIIVFIALFHINLTTSTDPNWWKHTTIYQIFIASFKDSNGDGIGDLNGITSKLDYFKVLGIECLYVTPFFKSGQNYAGYDIISYTDIQPTYGTMQDFDQLIQGMKRRGMKLIIDLVINHSGIQNEWFSKSRNREGKYTDYYVWADAKGYNQGQPIPPNNWVNVFGGSAWTWDDKRKQFYLHQFTGDQPDLNLRSDELKAEIKKIIAFWIEKGVSGIRLDAAQHFVEDAQLRDEPLNNPDKKKIDDYNDLKHIYTTHMPETYQVLHELRIFTDHYTKQNNKENCIYLAECTTADDEQMKQYYGQPDYPVMHLTFNFRFTGTDWYDARQFDDRIMGWLRIIPQWSAPNWMVENQDVGRVPNRYCEEYAFPLITAIMTLPGIAIVYYGQEIAISGFSRPGVVGDKMERLPMQWDSSPNAGFTTNRQPWPPANSNYWRVNVADQRNQKPSPYQMFKKLLRIRKTMTLSNGELKTYSLSTWIYTFIRSFPSQPSFVTVLNFGTNDETVNLRHAFPSLPEHLRIAVASPNAAYQSDDVINILSDFTMTPLSSLVLTTKV